VPCRHYSKRIFHPFNSTLWGGFVIRYRHSSGNYQTIYYGGDSGYGKHFKDIKTLFEPELAILPIGSYMPRHFMKPNHMSPKEAVQAFRDCGAGSMIAMHHSTFNLSNEEMDAPRRMLLQLTKGKNVVDIKPGDVVRI
jgi:L-ascorbate metabolism protein UlaG (beta-lactamase superfamily)